MRQHVMFDVDGTLLHTEEIDSDCYAEAVLEVTGYPLNTDWNRYSHISDAGIIRQHCQEVGLGASIDNMLETVKTVFTNNIKNHLRHSAVTPVAGAANFLKELGSMDDICVSIATGGWKSTAKLKLESAGIDTSGLAIATSDDHHARIEIMNTAAVRAWPGGELPCTYFGDGRWDKKACQQLGFNFVLVGSGDFHHQRIADYTDQRAAMAFIRATRAATTPI